MLANGSISGPIEIPVPVVIKELESFWQFKIEPFCLSQQEMSTSTTSLDEHSEEDADLQSIPFQDEEGATSPNDLESGSGSDSSHSASSDFIPVRLAFKDLFYSVKASKSKKPFVKKDKKTLLKDLSGEFRPGEVSAIMGPSGTYLL